MGGSSKQTIGYKYFGGMMVVIGNRIEKLLDINADNRGWFLDAQQKEKLNDGNATITINEPNLFGGSNQEGGWVGAIDVRDGSQTEANEYLQKQIDPEISAYPNLSYLVFRGVNGSNLEPSLDKGFELVSMSGMLKDFMLWVKRTRIKNDGNRQWYEIRPSDQAVVCEIDSRLYDDTCKPIDGYFSGFQGYLSVLGTKDPVGLIPSATSAFRWSGSESRGVITLEVRFKYASITEPTFDFRLQLNSASGLPALKTIGLKASISNVKHQTDQYWNYIIDYSVIVDKLCSITPTERTLRFEIEFSGDYTGLDSWSDIYYETAIGLPVVGGPCCPSNTKYNPDINPIHKIREILTDYTAMNKPELQINDQNFRDAADRIYDEGLGISWCIQEKSCKEALDELLYHIESGLRINRQTGLYEVVLFRDDLIDLDNSLSFNESNIKTINFDIANLDESISSINISYYDRELIKDSSFLLYDNGLERTRGFSISENIDFPYFMNKRNAEIVGNWKLKQLSSATWKGSFKTGISEARKINKYDVIKLSWKSKGLVDLPVRVININLGDGINNTVTIDFIEVIPYSNIDYTPTITDPVVDENLPPQININTAFEMPYFEAIQRFGQTQVDLELGNSPELGYLMASAARPQSNSLNAQLFSDGGTGLFLNISRAGVIDYCPSVYLDQSINQKDSTFKIRDLDYVENSGISGFSGATRGTWIYLNDEIMVFESFNRDEMEITVKRGALDTVPQNHDFGIIFFSDEFSGIDQKQYIQGEDVISQALTTTPSSMQNLNQDLSLKTRFNARAIRPYPPANVKINGNYYPDDIETDLVVTWSDRNRLQQTGGNIIGWYDDNITIESGTSTILIISEEDENHNIIATHNNDVTGSSSYTLPITSVDPNSRYLNIVAKTSRDGFDSFQKFEHNVEISLFFSAPYDIQYTVSES